MNLYTLDIDIDDTHQNGTGELDFWIHHLEEIKTELKRLYSKKKYTKHVFIEKAILLKTASTNSVLKALKNYKEFRDYWSKCDASQSGMPFIYEHQKHKKEYLKHISEYKRFKSKLTN